MNFINIMIFMGIFKNIIGKHLLRITNTFERQAAKYYEVIFNISDGEYSKIFILCLKF